MSQYTGHALTSRLVFVAKMVGSAAARAAQLQLEQLQALQKLQVLRKEQLELRLQQQKALYILLQGELPQLQLAPMQRQVVGDMVRCVSVSLSQISGCITALGRESCVDKTVHIVRLASEVDQTAGRVSTYARHLLAGLRDHPWRVQPARLHSPGGGLTPEQVRSIPLARGGHVAPIDTCCAICLEVFTPLDSLRTLPCMHAFHPHCVDPWLGIRNSCPLCKRPALQAVSLGAPPASHPPN